jgi:soluble lytic murein transglycosylase
MSFVQRWLALMCLCAVCVAAQASNRTDDPYRRERETFVRLYKDIQSGHDKGAAADDALRTYPLFPYLQAARLQRALRDAPEAATNDERIATFLTYYGTAPVTRDLRQAWLTNLAQRRAWERFLEHYVDTSANADLRCHSFTARIELGRTEGLTKDIAAHWLTPRRLPACERPFDWLREQKALSDELIEQRARRAIENNNLSFARQIIAMLPAERAVPLRTWVELLQAPRNIDRYIASPDAAIDTEILWSAWSRLARSDRDGAIARFDKLVKARRLTAEEASKFALALALPLSWDRRPEALDFFARVDGQHLDDYALEWYARAALWAQQWPLVARAIASMSDTQRGSARWRYWLARATEKQNDPATARQLYGSVMLDDNYYSAMAAARLGERIAPRLEKLPLDQTRLREVAELPELVRARELFWANMRTQAVLEWLQGYERLPQDARKQTIHLAAQWGWYDQAVATATQQRVFNDYALLYPQPFDREVQIAAQLTSLPLELIYGVLRQESLYRADAVSSAGARGLMQLLPETARLTARAWKQPHPSAQDLFNPSVNVKLGAGQLRMLVDRFGGQLPVALAGYNAGPNAAARWLPNVPIESDIWIENIPYNETRTYVQRIVWHSIVFAWLRTGEAQRTDRWLTHIAKPQATTVANAE